MESPVAARRAVKVAMLGCSLVYLPMELFCNAWCVGEGGCTIEQLEEAPQNGLVARQQAGRGVGAFHAPSWGVIRVALPVQGRPENLGAGPGL